MKYLKRIPFELGRYFSTGIVSVATLFRYSGELIIQIAIASQFGAGKEVDAYFAAWLIPSAVVFMLDRTVHNVLLPTLVSTKQQKGEQAAWLLVSSLSNTIILFLIIFTMFALFSINSWLDWILPGLDDVIILLSLELYRFQKITHR